jgi:hypothetical protein
LHANAAALFTGLAKIKQLKIKADAATPIIHLMLTSPFVSLEADAAKLSELANACVHAGVGVITSKFAISRGNDYSNELLRPSLIVCASSSMDKAQVKKIVDVVTATAKKVLKA